uniref:Uncharacterized protein n=1 Tax=Arundo donax TaxID=35708 RepID=A0A0A9BED0_ARUDO
METFCPSVSLPKNYLLWTKHKEKEPQTCLFQTMNMLNS